MIGILLENRYKLTEEIGSGGTAIVFKALDVLENKYYAVKIMRPELAADEELLYRFERESRALAELSHPNIVHVYSVGKECHEINGKEECLHYFIMDLIEGMTLKRYIAAHGALKPVQAGKIAAQVCDALAHAHSKRIIHRDIKSQNIILNRNMDVKVADFGIARLSTQTTVGGKNNSIMGSVHYMSPEQTRNGYVSESTDLYSLGVVLYEMLTGKLPFDGDDPVTIALKHVNESLPPMASVFPTLPRAYCNIVDKALKKKISERYATANEMEDDLILAIANPDGTLSDSSTQTPTDKPENAGAAIPVSRPVRTERHQNTERILARKKRQKQTRIVRICAAAAAFLVIVGVVLCVALWPKESKIVAVPNVVNIDYSTASTILHGMNIRYNVDSYIYSNDVPVGKIIAQSPEADTGVEKAKDIVHLIVSLGAKPMSMIEAVGQNVDDIIDALWELGIDTANIDIRYEESEIETGTVIAQTPLQNERVYSNGLTESGSPIQLVLAQKKQEEVVTLIEVPNLVGKTSEEAAALLQECGLSFIISESNSAYEYGKVFNQFPSALSKVDPTFQVKIFISIGPLGTIEMPSLLGMTEEEAINFITNKEFMPKIHYVYDDVENIGKVTKQIPTEKKMVNPVDNPYIEIWVSAVEPTPTPTPVSTPEPTPALTSTPEPTIEPIDTPEPTDTPVPTDTPLPTESPTGSPTETATPALTAVPTSETTPTPTEEAVG